MPTTLNSIMAEVTSANEAAAERARAPKNREAYGGGAHLGAAAAAEMEEPPTRPEVVGWYVYGLCTYFVQVFLLPVLFPLMVAQRASPASEMPPPPAVTSVGVACHRNGTLL